MNHKEHKAFTKNTEMNSKPDKGKMIEQQVFTLAACRI